MKSSRQWVAVGVIVGVIIALIGMGWFVRDRFLPVEVGSKAPDFTARDLQGNPVSLSDARGEVILLNIWATWCAPCREEMPSMEQLHRNFAGKGLEIVAVSVDSPVGGRDRAGNPGGDVEAFAKEMGLTFTIWRDPEGGIERIYRITGVPESFVIDRYGNIVTKVIGPTDWNSPDMQELFTRLLEG